MSTQGRPCRPRKPVAQRATPDAVSDGRDLAVRALVLMDEGMPVQAAVDAVLAASPLPGRERRLCAELVYGCARERIRCDFILARLMRKPQGLPRPMLHSLAIAVHSLLFQERIPAHAAVDSTVTQVRRRYGERLARVANGVLRSLQRLGGEPREETWYTEPGDPPGLRGWRAACRFWSLPEGIAELWRDAYGEKTARALLRRSFQRPWAGIRINRRHPRAAALRDALVAAVPEVERAVMDGWGVAVAPGALPEEVLGKPLARWREAGVLEFQSAGSQLVLAELGLSRWQLPVWDACAGVGGKTLALLDAGVPVRFATDLSAGRLVRLRAALSFCVLERPLLALADASQPPVCRWDGHILVDAPCSGLGVLARRPDIRFPGRRSNAVLRGYPALQGRLLTALAGRLQPGRELAYLTCTLNPAENEAVVGAVVKKDASLEVVRSWTTPMDHPWLEGMYGALLRRR